MVSRKVFISPCTFKPDSPWMVAQARAFVAHPKTTTLPAGVVLRDRDRKFTDRFDDEMRAGGLLVKPVEFRSPNMNAYIERFVQSIQQECLDRFIAFGREHFDLLISEYVEYYHHERPHQAKGNRPLIDSSEPAIAEGEIICSERLGGVLKSYARKAA